MMSGLRQQMLLIVWLLFLHSAYAQIADEGIPVTDDLVKAKCGSCHTSDDRGNLKRISWERATPEGWQRAIQRMILLDDVELTAAESAHLIQYLSTNHGLAPDETKSVTYDVERRIHEDPGIPKTLVSACSRCHNLARVFSWRRSADDWRQLSEAHALRYDARASEENIALLAKMAPLHTPEWADWSGRIRARGMSGRWLVTASVLGSIRYYGEMQMEAAGADGEFNTRATLRSVKDGSTVIRHGHGVMYGGYAWRGLSQGDNLAGSAPDSLAHEAREVMTSAPDQSGAEGRWFWGQYQELGFDISLHRASADPALLGIDPPLLKTGSRSKRIRLFGDSFPTDIYQTDLDLGPGVSVRRIVSHESSEIVAEVDIAADAPAGRRKVEFRSSVMSKAFAVYDRVDYIKVLPESSMAAFGELSLSRGYQQFDAIAYQNGPDGKRHTSDDVELGHLDATWSMKVFYESEGANTNSVGSITPTGLFEPAEHSPKNNFDVWVIAEARDERGRDGTPLIGKSYLVVTVPVYIFNGRRYVRDLDHWVDDGPARPVQQ